MKCVVKALKDWGGRNIQTTENKAIKEFNDYVRIINDVKRRQNERRRNKTWNKDEVSHVDEDDDDDDAEKKPKLLRLLTSDPRSGIITLYFV